MKYTIPGLSTLVAFVFWVSEKWISKAFGEEIKHITWGWIFVVAVALMLGMVYSDFMNNESKLRKWIGGKTKIAEIEQFVLEHKVENGTSWYEAVIHLRFLNRGKNVHYSVEITQYVGLNYATSRFLIIQDTIHKTAKNFILKIPIAKFPQRVSKKDSAGYPYWNDDKIHTWAGDGHHVVTLNLKSRIKRQVHKFLVAGIKDVGCGPEPVILFGDPTTQPYAQIN